MDSMSSVDRKDSHIKICLNDDVEYYTSHSAGFSEYRFVHDALPEIDFEKISISIELLGKKLDAPLIIGAMTGGTIRSFEINRRLAIAAETCQIGLALGSQRKMLELPAMNSTVLGDAYEVRRSYQVKKIAPNLPLLFGNLGAVQLNYGVTYRAVRELIDQVECDAFNFHLNPLQEAIQPEGNRNFSNLIKKLQDCIPELQVPVFIKEVGCGISMTTARKLKGLSILGVETAGNGGTSWSKIESLRSSDSKMRSIGDLFARWGISTVESIQICKNELPHCFLVASGGVRNGIEIAKAIALGADVVALSLPFLKAAEHSIEAIISLIQRITMELKVAMFMTGVSHIAELKERGYLLLQNTADQNIK
jgi:isopentenyl-diphosphate delta-isomerase